MILKRRWWSFDENKKADTSVTAFKIFYKKILTQFMNKLIIHKLFLDIFQIS